MYSILLLTALGPAADTPAGAKTAPPMVAPADPVVMGGCTGSCHGSCYGSCYGSCTGSGGHRRMLGAHRASCRGGGYSCSGYNCFGSCFGSCTGCAGCTGHGVSYGSSWGPPVGMPPYTLHGYNSDPHAVWGAGPPVVGGRANPNLPPVMTVPVAPPTGSDAPGNPGAANIKFKVPADAKLFVDGRLTTGTGPERAFYTPPLAAGRQFYYDVRVEVTAAGRTLSEEKRVLVSAGANLTEEFPKLTAALAGTGASVAGR